MRRRPNEQDSMPIENNSNSSLSSKINPRKIGLVLSGGGSRAAYQVGALKALVEQIEASKSPISVIVGSSIGAVNGLVIGACLKNGVAGAVAELESIWLERTFRNSFAGSASKTFFKAIKVAIEKCVKNPTPGATSDSIFDPTPLMQRVDQAISLNGGLMPENRSPDLKSIAVITAIEGKERKPLLFLSSKDIPDKNILQGASFEISHVKEMSAKHGFASAALPSVLPPVKIDIEGGSVSLVDGGIAQNLPVDPAVRLGADRILLLDVSGRDWWFNRYGKAHDTRPDWEIPAASKTYCLRPPETFIARCQTPLGPVLRSVVSQSTRTFIHALGPMWPIFTILKTKFGEEVAYEVLSYAALHPDYSKALIDLGYEETRALLLKQSKKSEQPKVEYQETPA